MKRVWALLALGLAAALHAATPSGSIDDLIAREMPASGAPGFAYAIVDNGQIRSDARGETRIGSGDKVTPDTPFLLGSLSKSFTAMAVMQLVEAGKVDLDAPISRYLEVFANSPAKAVTIRQLLSHTSGYSTLEGNQNHKDLTGGKDELARQVARIASWDLAHAPGTHWEYSNANYQILGSLIETLSGEDYAAYVKAHILEPIGMDHSFVADGALHDGMARGHRPWFGTKLALEPGRTDRITAPAGGVIASANDVARYLAVMMNGKDDVIRADTKAAMLRPANPASPDYGLGWFLDRERGTVYHTGSSPGVETLMAMLPAANEGAVVLVNAGSGIGFGVTAGLRFGIATRALGVRDIDDAAGWLPKATFVSLALLPVLFVLAMAWAWFHRDALRAKRGAAGLFSLWFPLVTTLAMAAALVWLVPWMFGVSLATLDLFAPDVALILIAGAVTGVVWALLRLLLAYGGRRRPAG